MCSHPGLKKILYNRELSSQNVVAWLINTDPWYLKFSLQHDKSHIQIFGYDLLTILG